MRLHLRRKWPSTRVTWASETDSRSWTTSCSRTSVTSNSGTVYHHPANSPHGKGEWIGAEIRVQTPLLAQYAVSHYLEQGRVLDADVVE